MIIEIHRPRKDCRLSLIIDFRLKNQVLRLKRFLIPTQKHRQLPVLLGLSNLPAEYPAACCGDESGLFPLPREGKLKMGRGQETSKTIKIGE